MFRKALCLTLSLAMLIFAWVMIPGTQPAFASTQTPAITVATAAQIQATGADFIDAPFSSWTSGGTRYWIHSDNWGDYHQKFSGPTNNPTQTPIFNKTKAQMFPGWNDQNGKPWIVNIYKDNYGGLLAFLHLEFVTAGGSSNKGRIGLAYSTNNGDTFTFLGQIIAPYGDPDMTGGFIQGSPYLVKDGYIYTYYSEYGTNVARAPLADVISAARSGTVCDWTKYYNGSFSQSGMFGNRSPITGASGVSVGGITHTQAAYSTYTGKYYLTITSMNWGGMNTYIRLFESSDCVTWELYRVVVDEPAGNYPANSGWQYSSIVDYGNEENATVGQLFYLYCGNRTSDTTNMTMKRMTIDLSKAPISSYSLDGNVTDAGHLNNTGSLVNGPSYTAGRLGQAVNLDGVNDYVNIPNHSELSGMAQLTLSCWVNLASLPNQNYVIVGKDSTDYQYRFVVGSNGTGHFVVNTTNNAWYSNGTAASWSTQLAINTWYHIVGTYDGNYVRVYINGSLAGTGAQPIYGAITTGTAPLRIGFKSHTSIDYTNGKVDEVLVYNRGLSSAEVTALYNQYSATRTINTASSQFSSTQGANNWYYYEWGSGYINQMTWDAPNSRWKGSETYSIIGSTWQHPGSAVDSARAWWANASKTIEIRGNASVGSTADGVLVTIQKNGTVIWTATLTANANKNFIIPTTVSYGDLIYFRVNKIGNNYTDSTTLNPTIIVFD